MNKIRLISLAVAVSLSAASSNTNALGLGSPSIQGIINRPLQVDLPIIAEDSDLHDIRAKIANEMQHQQFGLSYPQWMPKLKFDTIKTPRGAFLRVSSHLPIKEPIVDFVVAVDFKGMLLLKEITLFLDPIEHLQPDSSTLTTKVQNSENTLSPYTTAVGGPQINKVSASLPNSFRVERGQSLWRIAKEWKIKGASINQKMDAIFLANPHAFMKGDKNRLKQGSMLSFSHDDLKLAASQEFVQNPSQDQVTQNQVTRNQTTPNNETATRPISNELNSHSNQTLAGASNEVISAQSAANINKKLQIERELIELNSVINRQQSLNLALKKELAALQGQLELQAKIKIAKASIQSTTVTKPSTEFPATDNTKTSISNSVQPTLKNNATAPKVSRPEITDSEVVVTNDSENTTASPNSTWLTAIWFSLALIIAYVGTLLASKRKAGIFARKLDSRLQNITDNIPSGGSQTPSVKELSIPKNLSASVQIKYLNSAADFYIRCHRLDLAKELVNEGLIEFSGNPQIINTLNEIRKKILSHLDSDLHSHIVEKLDERSHTENNLDENSEEMELDENEINIEDFNEHWLRQWGKKVS